MFRSKESESSKLKEVETVIGPSVKVDGQFKGKGDVVVRGSLTGKLSTSKNLRVEEGANVKADVDAANVSVAGVIRGNVKVKEKLELAQSAKVYGDVEAKTISVAQGAVLNGKCVMLEDEEAKENKKNTKNRN